MKTDSAEKTERSGVLGLETEHVILFVPDAEPFLSDSGVGDVAGSQAPPFSTVQQVLQDCLLAGRKAAMSSGLKGGYFLENGGQVHFELYLHSQSDAPILEVATPECRSPIDLLTYSRAYDSILEETSRRSSSSLRALGYRGKIALGKNNLDRHGIGFGCHENYLVNTRLAWGQRLLLLLLVPALMFCHFPVFAFLLVDVLRLLFLKLVRPAARLFRTLGSWLRERHPQLVQHARTVYFGATTAILYPFIQVYSQAIRCIVLRKHIRALTPFLVTRQILSGAGRLNFRHGTYELSQRAELTRRVAEIVMFGNRKTIFDLKVILFDRLGPFLFGTPLSLFQPQKRLSITVGDSNLSDVPLLLKVGITHLLLEMIEAGVSFDDLEIDRPVKALREISREGPWKAFPMRSGSPRTALEIQRNYLERARAFFKGRAPGRARHGEILELWGDVIDRLTEQPHTLSADLDWAAKKQLLDRAVLGTSNWRLFFAWGNIFEKIGLEKVSRASSLGDLLRTTGLLRRFLVRRQLVRHGLDARDFHAQRELHFQARKIDLKYHELGGGTSYQRMLEQDGSIRRLTHDEEVDRAMVEPPPDTRARVRGFYIKQARAPESLLVNWNEIELLSPSRHILTPDPFQYHLPTD